MSWFPQSPSDFRILFRDVMQAVLACIITGGIFYMVFAGRVVPAELWAAWGLVIGFFFGAMGKQNGGELHLHG